MREYLQKTRCGLCPLFASIVGTPRIRTLRKETRLILDIQQTKLGCIVRVHDMVVLHILGKLQSTAVVPVYHLVVITFEFQQINRTQTSTATAAAARTCRTGTGGRRSRTHQIGGG